MTVARVEVKTGTEVQEIPFATERREDASMLTRAPARSPSAGVPGAKDVRLEDTYTNGALTNRAVLGETVLRTPVAEITLVGTKARPPPSPGPAVPPAG